MSCMMTNEISPPEKTTDYKWYVQGYTRAITDVEYLLNLYINDLRYHHKRLGTKEFDDFFKCLREHRKDFREAVNSVGPMPAIRYNGQMKGPEFFTPAQ